MRHISTIALVPSGASCGQRVQINGRSYRCKYHFFDKCFTSLTDAKRLVQPDPRDGRSVPWWFEPGCTEFEILNFSLEGSDAREDFPAERPVRFQREQRIYEPTQTIHHGWTPVWGNGLTWPYWSYQSGFCGNWALRKGIAALRLEVLDQIRDVRWGAPDGEEWHVHHEPPMTFKRLMQDWCASENVTPETLNLHEPHPGHKLLADRDQAERWQAFHAQNATLVAMTAEEHRQAHKPI